MKFDRKKPASQEGFSGSLWVFNKENEKHFKVIDIDRFSSYHNGARAQWVDNERIAFMDGDQIKVVNMETGEVVLGPIQGLLGHKPHEDNILVALNEKAGEWEKGLYQVDVNTGARNLIVQPKDFAPFKEEMGANRDPVSLWRLLHAQWSPNGEKVAARLDINVKDGTENERILVSCNNDGSDKVIFGLKPMHFQWYELFLDGHGPGASG